MKIPKTLYHYTDAAGLHGVIASSHFWASDYRFTNDKSEIEHALGVVLHRFDVLRNQRIGKQDFRHLLDFEPARELIVDHLLWKRNERFLSFLCSFTEDGNLLSQWRAYAPNNGFAIGLNGKLLSELASAQGFHFGKVIYNEDDQFKIADHNLGSQLDAILSGQKIDSHKFYQVVYGFLPYIKHKSFHEEREWRLFRNSIDLSEKANFRVRGQMLVPYTWLDCTGALPDIIEEFVIGPSDDPQRAKAMLTALAHKYDLKADIKASNVPYRLHN